MDLKQLRLKSSWIAGLYAVLGMGSLFALSACSGKVGFQGGYIARVFTGITSAEGISPTSVRLQWNDYPGATKYYVYSSESNNAINEVSFSTYVFKPAENPDPKKVYLYSVSAQDPVTGLEQGDRTAYTPVQVLEHHDFGKTGKVESNGKFSIRVTWTSFPGVNYRVYVAERPPTGKPLYNFSSANKTVIGEGAVVVDQLQQGRDYCAIVVATYADNNIDAPDGTMFTGDVGQFLNDPDQGYMFGSSGNFSDGIIAEVQKCDRTDSDFNTETYSVAVQQGNFSPNPIFYATDPADTVEDNYSPKVRFDIYKMSSEGGNSVKVGSWFGTGKIQSDPLVSGKYKFFAVAESIAGTNKGAQSIIEIKVGKKEVPEKESDRNWVYIRSFEQSETIAKSTAHFPEKQQGGFGSQQAGQSVAVGDFNCDGKKDLAMGIPNAIQYNSEDHLPSRQGRVVIYYDLAQNQNPETATRKQIITFDLSKSGYELETSRNLMLGTNLLVGNFNRDNQATNQFQGETNLKTEFTCDDLVIGSGRGPIFVLYGKRDVGDQFGGLNFGSEINFEMNPTSSCESSNNLCSPALYFAGSAAGTNLTRLGRAMTTGDYNGDGFQDLAVSTNNQGIWVFRGSESGLLAPQAITVNTDEIVSTWEGPYIGFPYIPNETGRNQAGVQTPPTANSLNWGSSGFGISLGTFHNAYYDPITKRVRSVLLIGNTTGGGRIHACIPKTDTTELTLPFDEDVLSANKFKWDCRQSLSPPQAPNDSAAYGSTMVSIENALRYRPDHFPCTSYWSGFGNCDENSTNLGFPGAFGVSDPTGLSQKVFIYYGLNAPLGTVNNTREELGIARNGLLNNLFNSGTISQQPKYADGNTVMDVASGITQPCEVLNNSTSERCMIQKIQHPSGYNCGFGMNLSAIPGSVTVNEKISKDTILAVSCPYRTITSSSGYSYSNVGSVQIFYQNSMSTSNFFKANNIERASDGFSNSMTTSLDYLGELQNNILFGSGGIAGGPINRNESETDYSSFSDVFIGSPGFSKPKTVNGKVVNIIDNGAVFSFFSHGGTFRRYPMVESGPNPSLWHEFSVSFSQESDYNYHQVVSIGDVLNSDGIGDIAVRLNRGSRNQIRFYPGRKKDSIGFDESAAQNFFVSGDSSAGMRFVPAGKVGNGDFPFFFITGKEKSYLFASGIGGIIQGQPAPFALPLLFKSPWGSPPQYANNMNVSYLDFSDSSYFNAEVKGLPTSTLRPNVNFARGDFNGDGHEDFAMGMNKSFSIRDVSSVNNQGAVGSAYGAGRVLVWYGGGDNGFQTVPDIQGGYPLSSDYFTGLSSTVPVNFGGQTNLAPCDNDGKNCKIQTIMEPDTSFFGESLLSVPIGKCSINNQSVTVHALLIYGRNTNDPVSVIGGTRIKSSVYIYKPKCLSALAQNSASNFSGLMVDAQDNRIYPRTNSDNSEKFGYSMALVKNVRGESATTTNAHVVISDQSSSLLYIYPLNSGDSETFLGLAGNRMLIGMTNDEWNQDNRDKGLREVDYTNSQMMKNKLGSQRTGTELLFAHTMAEAGDLNGDGYNDLAVSIPLLTRKETSSGIDKQGGLLILFGGTKGFQTHGDDSMIYQPERYSSCYLKSGTDSICKPNLIFLPQIEKSLRNGEAEMIYLPQDSIVNFGEDLNDGLGTMLIGSPGKDSKEESENDRILNAGGFYEIP